MRFRAAAMPSRAGRRAVLSTAALSLLRTAAKFVSPLSKCRHSLPREKPEKPKPRRAALPRRTPSPRCSKEPTSCCGAPTLPPTGTAGSWPTPSTAREGIERSVQADLLAGGFARVGGRIGTRECATELLARERAARKAKLGLWAISYYDLLDADNPADVLAERGRFALVEGKVVSVRESGATIYVNFGRRWTEDFTVTILKRNERSFAAAGVEPKRLSGRRVRVRGWIEERGGPWIEAARPEQIELIDRE